MVQVPRAVELRVPLVRSTGTWITAVVSDTGEFLLEIGLHERRVDKVTVTSGKGFNAYRVVGDVFAWLCVAGALVALGAVLMWRTL